ncbi:Jag protein [Compostibacillus humi]|uniref:RNA-binding protein KhpB n=1 Tax=Compostibacillus humi TaxID=1245525 RepID=A0A8J2TU32_9BACI|nr:RNA-binding cell elongation regulator Jag/EloR [Compostibacillus humi]GFZ92037.1 Jag protein [Compostibacillus humi]HLT55932.1 RNA-binding cell elongation regulator Jag/EloR [Bacillota bacterium]
MREVTASGQTLDEAVQSALEQLNTTKDHVEIDVIDEGKKGILGIFGSKRAVVKVRIKKDPIKETEKFILNVTKNMGADVEINTTVNDKHVTFELTGKDIALLIGKRGQTLNALQYLVHLVLNKESQSYYRVTLDAEGYRERRKETLESLALKKADRAIKLNKEIKLEPMPAFERKIIHTVLQEKEGVSTFSDGTEPHRYIVIAPKS